MESKTIKNDRKSKNHRVGRRIRAKKVRVIDSDGKNIGIIDTRDAMKLADEQGLDLVEVNYGETPTCKILDYGKLKYQESKKEKDKKKDKKTHEVQFRPKIAEHDLEVKLKNAKKFLEKGSTVNLIVQFKGREVIHPETGKVILDRAEVFLKESGTVIKKPTMHGKKMSMVMVPKSS